MGLSQKGERQLRELKKDKNYHILVWEISEILSELDEANERISEYIENREKLAQSLKFFMDGF